MLNRKRLTIFLVLEIATNFHNQLLLVFHSTNYCYYHCLNAGMIPQILKKRQETFGQICHCNLTSRSSSCYENEKFLTRLQAQRPRVKLQVNETVNSINLKQREPKLSLKMKEKRLNSTQKQRLTAIELQEKQKCQIKQSLNKIWQIPYNFGQNFNKTKSLVPIMEEQQIIKQNNLLRQQFCMLSTNINQQNQQKRANTENSTIVTNAAQYKNSLQSSAAYHVNKKHQVNECISVSASSQQTKKSVEQLLRSKAFSTNLNRKNSIIDDLYYEIPINLQNKSFKQLRNQQVIGQNFSNLMFKSVQSFSEFSSDQFSELECNNQYLTHPSITQSSWSKSLNEIFAKKMKRLSHSPNF